MSYDQLVKTNVIFLLIASTLGACQANQSQTQAKPPQFSRQPTPGQPGYVGPCYPNMPMPNGCSYGPAQPPQGQATQPYQPPPTQPYQPQGQPTQPYQPQTPPTQSGWQLPTGWFPQPTQPQGQPTQPTLQPQATASGPLLAPLVGSAAMQSEVRIILTDLINNLGADNKSRVQGIPLKFESTNEVNAYAGCENGASFMAGTEGFLQAAMAIGETIATDDLYGTHTYDAYTNLIVPQILKDEKQSPALPQGIIPAQYAYLPQRMSHAREIFGDVVAFTFGHELGHHYLGHTGCANNAARDPASQLTTLLGHVVPVFGQFQESQADAAGAVNALDSGLARRPNYRWSERGGVLLLDFFSRLERAASGQPFNPLNPLNLLRTHPNPTQRIPAVQSVARDWYSRHPGVQ